MKSTLRALLTMIGLWLFIGAKAQCPQNFLQIQPSIMGSELTLFVFNQSNAAIPIDLNVNFGDGSLPLNIQMSTAFTWQHSYNSPGTYLLCVTGIDANGCADTLCEPIFAQPCLPGSLQVTVADSVVGNNVYLYPNVTGGMPPYSFQASSNGNTSTGFPLTFNYPSTGIYQYCLTVTDGSGCSTTLCDSVQIGGCSGVPVTFAAQAQLPSTAVVFTGTASGNIAVYEWVIQGQTVGTSPSFIYTFPTPGVYSVCLEVTDVNGCTGTYCQPVQAGPNCQTNPITANFVPSVSGDSVFVQGVVTGGCGNYTYNWTASGGQLLSGGASPVFLFSQDGNYAIITTLSDACGCSSIITIPVTIGCGSSTPINLNMGTGGSSVTTCAANFYDPGGPNANYPSNNANIVQTIYPSQAGAQLRVTFNSYDLETNFDYLHIYNGTSTAAPLLATLNGVSNTPLTLIANNPSGALTFNFTTDVSVLRPGWNATLSCLGVSFTAAPLNGGPEMLFTATTSQAVAAYNWTFGDGNVGSTGPTITHDYAIGGSYPVCLTVTTDQGCTFQACSTIYVPCTNFAQLSTSVDGNQVQLIVPEIDPNFFYSVQLFGSNGAQQWQQLTSDTTTISLNAPGTYEACLYVDGPCFDSTCTSVTISAEGANTVSGWVWDDENGNGVFDQGELPIPQAYVQICADGDTSNCQWAITDINGFYSFLVFDGEYTVHAWTWNQLMVQTLPTGAGNYSITLSGGAGQGNLNFGFDEQSAVISGTVYQDYNGNGIQDAGEPGLPNKWIVISGGFGVYTNAQGFYTTSVSTGAVVVSLNQVPSGVVVTEPTSPPHHYSLTLADGLVYDSLDFGLYADPDLQDLSASIYNISTVTPGFPVMNSLSYCNNGAIAQSGTFTLYWDPLLSISSGSVFNPQPSSFNAAGNTASWNFSNLAPGQCGYIYWNSPAPVSLQLGTPIFNTVMVMPLNDANSSNNIDTTHQVVVGSWDPNDKHGTPAGIGEQGSVLPNTRITYTIRFQNTGTAPAVNVVLVDTISTDLDLESFAMNASSHNYQLSVDNDTRVLRWVFSGIMLPDSTSDPIGSIGFVNFSISPNPNQPDGTVLANFCDIYFDFNEPIRTNTEIHTIDRFLAVADLPQLGVEVFPNPSYGLVQFKVFTGSSAPAEVEILNVLGQVVSTFEAESGKTTVFDGSTLASGLYVYRVRSAGRTQSGKLVIR